MTDTTSRDQLVLITIGAIMGILSLGILIELLEVNMWLSPVLGLLALIFLAMGLTTDKMEDIKYEDNGSQP